MGIVRRVFESVNIKLDLNFLQIKFFTSFRKGIGTIDQKVSTKMKNQKCKKVL
jgi:hypothetical protein